MSYEDSKRNALNEAQSELRKAEARCAELEKKAQQEKTRCKKLREEIKTLQGMLPSGSASASPARRAAAQATASAAAPAGTTPATGATPARKAGLYTSMTILSAIKHHLHAVPHPQTTQDIANELVRGGFVHNSSDWRNTVNTVLSRAAAVSDGVRRLKRGVWEAV